MVKYSGWEDFDYQREDNYGSWTLFFMESGAPILRSNAE
jgi:hypothetical protein